MAFQSAREEVLKPTKLESLTDHALAFFSPSAAIKRMQARRAFKAFAYKGGQRGSRERQNATIFPNSSPESSLIQLERIQLIWENRDLSDNFGVVDNIYRLYCDYVLGNLHNIRFNTGNKDDDVKLQNKWRIWCRLCDYTNRDNFNMLMRLAKRSQLRDGDIDVRFVSDTIQIGESSRKILKLQLIEADCIGSPFNIVVSRNYIGGLILEPDSGRVLRHDIYRREPQGSMYVAQEQVPVNELIHFRSLRRSSQYRGIPLLATAIPAYRDLKEILENERIATKVLSAYTMFIAAQTGDSSDDDSTYVGVGGVAQDPGTGEQNIYKDVAPGTIMYGNPGEKPENLTPDRPSPAFQGLVKTLFVEIFQAAGIGYNFAYEGGDINGVYARLDSAKTQRTFEQDWRFTFEYLLSPTVHRWMEFEIDNGYMQDISRPTLRDRTWESFGFTRPAHPTVDVGRESTANLAELNSSVKSRKTIAEEQGLNWDDEQAQILKEKISLSGGNSAVVNNLASTIGERGLSALVQLVVAFGQGQVDHETAIGFAANVLGVDEASAEEIFPKSSEKEPPALPAPGSPPQLPAMSRAFEGPDDEARDEDGKWTDGASSGGDKAEPEEEKDTNRPPPPPPPPPHLTESHGRIVPNLKEQWSLTGDQPELDSTDPEMKVSKSEQKDFNQKLKEWSNKVKSDPDAVKAFGDFKGSDYQEINHNPDDPRAKEMTKYLADAPNLKNGPLYRGMTFETKDQRDEFVKALTNSDVTLNNTVTSFAKGDMNTAVAFTSGRPETDVMIRVTKYKEVKDLAKLWGAKDYAEKEVLMPRGSKLHLDSISTRTGPEGTRPITVFNVSQI